MTRFILIFLTTASLHISCKKEKIEDLNLIHATIYCLEDYRHTEYLEDGDIVSLVPDPESPVPYNFSITHNEKWVFEYKPEYDYRGTDSYTFYKRNTYEGNAESGATDSLKITIEVISDKVLQDKFIGKWKYIQTCGGYDGGCWQSYPENDINIVEFKDNMVYNHFVNDSLQETYEYQFIFGQKGDDVIGYLIGFGDAYETFCWISNNTLKIQDGDAAQQYDKIE